MKKRTLKSIVLTAVMVMALSMSACGSKEADAPADTNEVEDAAGTEDESQAEAEAEPEAEPETEAEAEPEADGLMTVEDYYNDPEVKAAFEEQIAAAAGQGMSISIEAKGNDFAMIYQYDPDFVLADDAADQLDAALESNAAIFEAQAQVFDTAIGQEGACTVIVQYLDAEGNLIAEKSYKAQ